MSIRVAKPIIILLAAVVTAAASASLYAQACGARVSLGDGVRCCAPEGVTRLLVDILERASDVYDGVYTPRDVEELKSLHPWAEVVLPAEQSLHSAALRGDMRVGMILVVFRGGAPSHVFWGLESYDARSVLSAAGLGPQALNALRALAARECPPPGK